MTRKQKLEKNLFLLDKYSNTRCQEKIDALKMHICDILCLMKSYKEGLAGKNEEKYETGLIHDRMVLSLREIEKLEASLEFLEDLKYDIKFSGNQVLYPSENVMFISLYDKVEEKEFNIFSVMAESVSDEGLKRRRLWGDQVGREEGENIASRMRKFWERTRRKDETLPKVLGPIPGDESERKEWMKRKVKGKIKNHFTKERDLINFSYTFETVLPPRLHMFLTDYQKTLASRLPETELELRSIVKDEEAFDRLINICVELVSTRSQTSLSAKFLDQRLSYLRGMPVENPIVEKSLKLGLLKKAIRNAVAEAFIDYFKIYQNERKNALKEQIREGILQSLSISA